MSFASGSVASSATPAKALVDLIKTQLDAHAAWSFVEDVTSGTNTTTVYKCLGTVNTHGVDFYIAIYRSSDSVLGISTALGELYNSTTHVLSGQVPSQTLCNAFTTPDANGYHTTTQTLGTGISNCMSVNISINSTSFTYYISVTNDRLVYGTTSSGTDNAAYVGAYERLYTALQDPAPLINCPMAKLSIIGTSAIGMFTREITAAAGVNNLWKGYTQESSNPHGPQNVTNLDVVMNEYPAVKCIVGAATSSVRANGRGLLRDVLYCPLNVTAINGDTMTVNSETWTRIGNTGTTLGNFWSRNAA